jgi:predicted nucleotidyltransferase component of viral defense system
MIGFGELRRLSLQWQTDIAVVERAYALDWLLKGIFDRRALHDALALRGAAAISKAYLAEYPQPEDADFARAARLDDATLEHELRQAAEEAARGLGLSFKLDTLAGTLARFEYTGPLGRRSAAQPHLPLRFLSAPPRAPAVARPLLHPFSDKIQAMVKAISLEELLAEQLARVGGRPRARDVYDLWFILTRGGEQLDRATARALAEQIAAEKGAPLRGEFDPAYRPALERAWENALKNLHPRPSFEQAESEIRDKIAPILW